MKPEDIKHYYTVGTTLKPSKFFGYATIIDIDANFYEVYTDFGNIFNISWEDIVEESILPTGVFEWDEYNCKHPSIPLDERIDLQIGNLMEVKARLIELGLYVEE